MIAIFTDFGVRGPYLGQMHAVLAERAPGVPVVDIFPDLPAFNIKAAAYLLPAYSRFLPVDAVCLCVVDPGVGSDRRPVAVRTDGRWFVGPDNGMFSILVRRARHVEILFLGAAPQRLSATFHGRDLFAPVAAQLARGVAPDAVGVATEALVAPDWPAELAEVVYLDAYGNALTGLRASTLAREAALTVAGRVCRFRRTFAEARPGEVFWYENANGLAELAMNQGSVADALNLSVGTRVQLC